MCISPASDIRLCKVCILQSHSAFLAEMCGYFLPSLIAGPTPTICVAVLRCHCVLKLQFARPAPENFTLVCVGHSINDQLSAFKFPDTQDHLGTLPGNQTCTAGLVVMSTPGLKTGLDHSLSARYTRKFNVPPSV